MTTPRKPQTQTSAELLNKLKDHVGKELTPVETLEDALDALEATFQPPLPKKLDPVISISAEDVGVIRTWVETLITARKGKEGKEEKGRSVRSKSGIDDIAK